MELYTNSPRVRRARKTNVQLIPSQHDGECTACVRQPDHRGKPLRSLRPMHQPLSHWGVAGAGRYGKSIPRAGGPGENHGGADGAGCPGCGRILSFSLTGKMTFEFPIKIRRLLPVMTNFLKNCCQKNPIGFSTRITMGGPYETIIRRIASNACAGGSDRSGDCHCQVRRLSPGRRCPDAGKSGWRNPGNHWRRGGGIPCHPDCDGGYERKICEGKIFLEYKGIYPYQKSDFRYRHGLRIFT